MTVKLPPAFVERMKIQLGEQFDAFLASYEQARYYGLRMNPLKISESAFLDIAPFPLRPIAWAEHAFYYAEPDRPGRHPYYHAGLYYIQEPSAMAPAALLDVKPGDKVLDLCAAPGGKSTQLAAKLQGQGLLVSNDQSAERTKALVKNLELFGVRNAMVLNESPHRLSARFAGFFDKILVDAPCSGEGMFRKDEDMWREWSEQSIHKCTLMQRDILRHAALMLAPSGTLVYSTCTFAVEENEQMMMRFLEENADFELVPIVHQHGFAPGQLAEHEGTATERERAQRTIRLWPHLLEGEGHFVAMLRKRADASGVAAMDSPDEKSFNKVRHNRPAKRRDDMVKAPAKLDDLHHFFAMQTHLDWRAERYETFGDHVYRLTSLTPVLDGLKVVRPGMYVGILKKNRFEPSHALALALRPEDVRCSLSLAADDERLLRYLRGETLDVAFEQLVCDAKLINQNSKMYVLVCVGAHSVGWAKWQQGVLKNEYPQTWRRLS